MEKVWNSALFDTRWLQFYAYRSFSLREHKISNGLGITQHKIKVNPFPLEEYMINDL